MDALHLPAPHQYAEPAFPYNLFAHPAPPQGKAAKVCSQCGTSRTPQWREGPEGPKTLCNACGVKRCRQLRMTEPKRKANAARAVAQTLSAQQDTEDEADASYLEGPAPKRKTTSKASRSWKAADNDTDSQDTPAPSLSAGTVGVNSDSAEEDAWSPRAPTPKEATSKPAAGSKASNSPTYATVDPESTAAVNLLAMSHKPKPHSSSGSHPAAPAPGRSHPAAVTSGQEASKATQEQAPMTEGQQLQYLLSQPMLAPPQLEQLQQQQAMLLQMHELERQAVVAEAAVAAVAQVLAKKQATATQARFDLAQAQKRAFSLVTAGSEQPGPKPEPQA